MGRGAVGSGFVKAQGVVAVGRVDANRSSIITHCSSSGRRVGCGVGRWVGGRAPGPGVVDLNGRRFPRRRVRRVGVSWVADCWKWRWVVGGVALVILGCWVPLQHEGLGGRWDGGVPIGALSVGFLATIPLSFGT